MAGAMIPLGTSNPALPAGKRQRDMSLAKAAGQDNTKKPYLSLEPRWTLGEGPSAKSHRANAGGSFFAARELQGG
jgi:hypothetical protein